DGAVAHHDRPQDLRARRDEDLVADPRCPLQSRAAADGHVLADEAARTDPGLGMNDDAQAPVTEAGALADLHLDREDRRVEESDHLPECRVRGRARPLEEQTREAVESDGLLSLPPAPGN